MSLLAFRWLFGLDGTPPAGTPAVRPVIRDIKTGADASDTATSHTVAKPTGLAVGDYLIAFHGADAEGLTANMTAAGFARRSGINGSGSGNSAGQQIWTKVADASDINATPYTFGDSVVGASEQETILVCIQAGTYDTANPVTFSSYTQTNRVAAMAQTAPSMTGVADGLLLCSFVTESNGTLQNYTSSTPPTGMTFRASVAGDPTTPYSVSGLYSQDLTSTAATGTKTVTPTLNAGGSTTTNGWLAISVIVNPKPGTTGTALPPPVVSAGVDASATQGVAFSRVGSATNTPTSYAWKISSGPSNVGDIIGTSATLNWTPPSVGTYVLTLFATNATSTGYDQMTLTVNPAAPPVVTVGGASTHAMLINEVLTRTATETNSPTSRSWTINSGPHRVGEVLSTTTALSFTPTLAGTYVLRFTSTNGSGSSSADITVTVSNPPLPLVDAGADPTPFALTNSFLRTATESSAVQVSARAWTVTSGPAQVGTVLSTSTSVTWTPTTAGQYALTYSATNPTGTGSDTVVVNVGTLPATRLNIGSGSGKNHWAVDHATAGNPRVLYSTATIGAGYQDYPHFYANAADTATQFWARVDEATTSGANYSRSEMREQGEDGTDFGFDPQILGRIHRVRAKTKITHVPAVTQSVVTAQLHTGLGDAMQIRSQLSGSTLQLILRINGTSNPTINGQVVALPKFATTYVLGTEFEWMIEIDDDTCYVYYNDWSVPFFSFPVSTFADPGAAYNFKVGAYNQSSFVGSGKGTQTESTTDWGSADHRNLQHWHTGWATPENYLALPVITDIPDPAAFTQGIGSYSYTAVDSGSVTARKWTIVKGPVAAGGGTGAVGSTLSTTAAVTFNPTVAGTYILRYVATNANGSVGENVKVVANANTPPTVNAGNDTSVLVNNQATLTGVETGSPATSRAWTLQSAPAGVTYNPATSLSTVTTLAYTPTVAGSYIFRFTATNAAGSNFDEVVLTVNGPPIVGAGIDASVVNRTEFTRVATESGGGGITARQWSIVSGPSGVTTGNIAGQTSQTLTYTPTRPGNYTLRYSATNPYGTHTDDLILTVTAVTVALPATTELAVSTPTGNLAVRKLYRESKTISATSSNPGANLKVIRLVKSTKQALSDTQGGKPRVATRLTKIELATTPAQGSLVIRKLYRESKTEQAVSSNPGANLRVIRLVKSTSTETTPATANKPRVVTRITSSSSSAASATAKLTRVYKYAKTELADSTISQKLSARRFYAKTITAASAVGPANLLQPYTLRAAAESTAIGSLGAIARVRSTSTAVGSETANLRRIKLVASTSASAASATARLTKTSKLPSTTAASYSDVLPVRLIVRDQIRGEYAFAETTAPPAYLGIISPLGTAQLARAVSSIPPLQLRRVGRMAKTETANTTLPHVFYRVSAIAGTKKAVSSSPLARLVRMKTLLAPVAGVVARSTVPGRNVSRVSVFFGQPRAVTSANARLRRVYRYLNIRVVADSRFAERGGYAALTTAKAVTTNPTHRMRQTRVIEGFSTIRVTTTGDLQIFRALGYTRAKSTMSGNLRRRGVLKSRVEALAFLRNARLRDVHRMSTILEIFEDEEYDAFVETENYTGSHGNLGVVARDGNEAAVYARSFTQVRR